MFSRVALRPALFTFSAEGVQPFYSSLLDMSWTYEAEKTMLELVKDHRHVWDPRHALCTKLNMRKKSFEEIAATPWHENDDDNVSCIIS